MRLDSDIKVGMNKFGNNMSRLTGAMKKYNREAAKVLQLIHKRKMFFNNSKPKIEKAVEIIKENKGKKIIVFAEYIKSIDTLYQHLKAEGINTYVYYSSNNKDSLFKLNTKDKKELMYDRFD